MLGDRFTSVSAHKNVSCLRVFYSLCVVVPSNDARYRTVVSQALVTILVAATEKSGLARCGRQQRSRSRVQQLTINPAGNSTNIRTYLLSFLFISVLFCVWCVPVTRRVILGLACAVRSGIDASRAAPKGVDQRDPSTHLWRSTDRGTVVLCACAW